MTEKTMLEFDLPYLPDTSELTKGCDMLREIYCREYGRGWREALAHVKKVLEMPPVSDVIVPEPAETTSQM